MRILRKIIYFEKSDGCDWGITFQFTRFAWRKGGKWRDIAGSYKEIANRCW